MNLKLSKFLKEKLASIFVFLLIMTVFLGYILLFNVRFYVFLYPAIFSFTIFCGYLILNYIQQNKKHKRLIRYVNNPTDLDTILKSDSYLDIDYKTIIENINIKVRKFETENLQKEKELYDYFLLWVHQIKNPIASMKLKLEMEDSEISRKLALDLFAIEKYVEMTLAYLKLNSKANDYCFRKQKIKPIINESIKKYASLFIESNLKLEVDIKDEFIITDEKWLAFIIEQILSNSLKYTRQGKVSIFYNAGKLNIQDTGIGIDKSDLPLVFSKGYTGLNGRIDKKASGLGLYLVKKTCDDLGLNISIDSKVNEGTVVTIDLEKKIIEKD